MSHQQTDKPAAIKKREVQKGYREARRLDSLRAILEDAVLRRYLWELLDKMEPLGDARMWSPHGGYDTHATAANAAVKALGSSILNDIAEINPQAFLLYLEERKLLSKEEEGLQDDA